MNITVYAFFEPVMLAYIYPQDPNHEGLDREEVIWNRLVAKYEEVHETTL